MERHTPRPPSCYVLYTPSTSTPNFGLPPPPLPKLKILYETLHTHAHTHSSIPEPPRWRLWNFGTSLTIMLPAPLKSRYLQLPPFLDNFLNETLMTQQINTVENCSMQALLPLQRVVLRCRLLILIHLRIVKLKHCSHCRLLILIQLRIVKLKHCSHFSVVLKCRLLTLIQLKIVKLKHHSHFNVVLKCRLLTLCKMSSK